MDIKLTDRELVDLVLKKTEVSIHWLFRQAYLYVEEPKERWEISWAVQKYCKAEEIPQCVVDLCQRMKDDNQNLFWRRD